MTDQELKKLHRTDLLELLIAQEKENEQLRAQVAQLEAQLADRRLDLKKAGSIAEAALQVNGVFQAAQDAAAQYLENVQRLSSQQEALCRQLEAESRQAAEQRMAETQQKCQEMLSAAEEEAQSYWTNVQRRMEEYCAAHEELKSLFAASGGRVPRT